MCVEHQKEDVQIQIPFKDDFVLNSLQFQQCVTKVEYQTSRTGRWMTINLAENVKLPMIRKSVYFKLTSIDMNKDGKKKKTDEAKVMRDNMKMCIKSVARKGRLTKDSKMFTELRGGKSKLLFKAINSTQLEVTWANSFEVNFDVIKSVKLFKTTPLAPSEYGQAEPPFDEKNIILTSKPVDLCLAHWFYVEIQAKDVYYEEPWYKTHISSQETTWHRPDFLRVIKTYITLLANKIVF